MLRFIQDWGMMTGALKYASFCHPQNYVDKNIKYLSHILKETEPTKHMYMQCTKQDIAVQNLCELSKHESV